MDAYKIEQLKMMLEAETGENGGYGAHLTHWTGTAKEINIDAGAIQVLINYYAEKWADQEMKRIKVENENVPDYSNVSRRDEK